VDGLNMKFPDHRLFKDHYAHFNFESPMDFFNDFAEKTIKQRIVDYFEGISRREVLGRIGENNILTYHFITPDTAKQIAESALKKATAYYEQDHDFHLHLEISQEAKDYILNSVVESSVLDLGGRGVVTRVTELLSLSIQSFIYAYGKEHGKEGHELVFDSVSGTLKFDQRYGLYVQ
ncbi:MAG: hypothetical protein J6328_05290, partial [Bacilli bacterium]|nr:hypothetical protein [Bacilli bacterium]